MFAAHVPADYRDRAPVIVRDANGIENWSFQGTVTGSMGLNAVVSWPKEEWGLDPTTFAEMRPGAYNIAERIRDMNHNGSFEENPAPTFQASLSGNSVPSFAAIIRAIDRASNEPSLKTVFVRIGSTVNST